MRKVRAYVIRDGKETVDGPFANKGVAEYEAQIRWERGFPAREQVHQITLKTSASHDRLGYLYLEVGIPRACHDIGHLR